MRDRKKLRLQELDLLRFPMAVVVVAIHTLNSGGFRVQGLAVSLEGMPVTREVIRFLEGSLWKLPVPLFFFISGFVFFLGADFTKEAYARKLGSRVKTLLIPYLIWNVAAVLWGLVAFIPCLSPVFPNAHGGRLDFSLSAVLATFWDARRGIFGMMSGGDYMFPQDYPLWFVRELMVVAVCTPVLHWLMERMRCRLVAVLGVAWFVSTYRNMEPVNLLLTAFFFFSWGAYMSVFRKDLRAAFGRFFKPSAVLFPLLGLLYVASSHFTPPDCQAAVSCTIRSLNVLVGLFFAYGASAWLSSRRVCGASPFLAASSFFIYAGHVFVSSYVLKLLYLLLKPVTDAGMLSFHVLAVAVVVGFLLLVFRLLGHHAPSLLDVLVGRTRRT